MKYSTGDNMATRSHVHAAAEAELMLVHALEYAWALTMHLFALSKFSFLNWKKQALRKFLAPPCDRQHVEPANKINCEFCWASRNEFLP